MQGTEVSDLYQTINCPGFAQDFRDPVPLKLLRDYSTPVGAACLDNLTVTCQVVFLSARFKTKDAPSQKTNHNNPLEVSNSSVEGSEPFPNHLLPI